MSFPAPAANVATPVTANAPESVIAPLVLTPNVPDTVEAPKIRASASVIDTLFPLVTATVVKLLVASSRVMSFPDPAARVVTPVMANAPESVMAPLVLTPNVPDTVEAPRIRASASVTATLFPLVITTVL